MICRFSFYSGPRTNVVRFDCRYVETRIRSDVHSSRNSSFVDGKFRSKKKNKIDFFFIEAEMNVHSFHQHVRNQAAPPPRTMREEEMLEIKQREVRRFFSFSVSKSEKKRFSSCFRSQPRSVSIVDIRLYKV